MIHLFLIAKWVLEWITSLIQRKESWPSWFNFEFHRWNMLAILSILNQYYKAREEFIYLVKSEEKAQVAWLFPFCLPQWDCCYWDFEDHIFIWIFSKRRKPLGRVWLRIQINLNDSWLFSTDRVHMICIAKRFISDSSVLQLPGKCSLWFYSNCGSGRQWGEEF